ncbi:uncharacterized protein EMH_0057510 [Eimeria mitis]|uniref:Protein kinase domain-containing protein n=1 Tax=Eimeria mitis TaxID=44415 RepID=U6JY29_9EIME|nr:uncharacterized protein EMH_0057510 [Eimeria mitis]CDJ30370.1 hypothetical protein, conserved [Eimeria mitis]
MEAISIKEPNPASRLRRWPRVSEAATEEDWRKRLVASWRGVRPRDSAWELPDLKQFEESLPRAQRTGKELIAAAVQQRELLGKRQPSQKAKEVMETLAKHLSDGKTRELIGMKLTLTNAQALGSADVDEADRNYVVTGFLGEGSRAVVLEVTEEFTNKPYAMKLIRTPMSPVGRNAAARGLASLMATVGTMEETTAMLQAVGTTSPSEAAETRGLAVCAGIATIKGVPFVMECPSGYALSEVQLMERFKGDLAGIFGPMNPLPVEAKVYAGRRLLLEVLQMQRAGFSHNDLKLSNFFMRDDGSFLLGDFGAGTLIGQPLDSLNGLTPQYAELELGAFTVDDNPFRVPPVVDEKSDMWSLGLCLYRIFTDGRLPYGLMESRNPVETLKTLAEQNVSPKTLRLGLMEANVPYVWQDLIMDLLNVERRNRINAVEVAANYINLVY